MNHAFSTCTHCGDVYDVPNDFDSIYGCRCDCCDRWFCNYCMANVNDYDSCYCFPCLVSMSNGNLLLNSQHEDLMSEMREENDDVICELKQRIDMLNMEILDLNQQLIHEKYKPAGSGYEAALQDFNSRKIPKED